MCPVGLVCRDVPFPHITRVLGVGCTPATPCAWHTAGSAQDAHPAPSSPSPHPPQARHDAHSTQNVRASSDCILAVVMYLGTPVLTVAAPLHTAGSAQDAHPAPSSPSPHPPQARHDAHSTQKARASSYCILAVEMYLGTPVLTVAAPLHTQAGPARARGVAVLTARQEAPDETEPGWRPVAALLPRAPRVRAEGRPQRQALLLLGT